MCATPFAVREICTVLAGGAAAVVGAPPETVEHATIFTDAARQSAPSATRPGDCKFTSTPEASSSIGSLAATTAIRKLSTTTRLILYEGSCTPTFCGWRG